VTRDARHAVRFFPGKKGKKCVTDFSVAIAKITNRKRMVFSMHTHHDAQFRESAKSINQITIVCCQFVKDPEIGHFEDLGGPGGPGNPSLEAPCVASLGCIENTAQTLKMADLRVPRGPFKRLSFFVRSPFVLFFDFCCGSLPGRPWKLHHQPVFRGDTQ